MPARAARTSASPEPVVPSPESCVCRMSHQDPTNSSFIPLLLYSSVEGACPISFLLQEFSWSGVSLSSKALLCCIGIETLPLVSLHHQMWNALRLTRAATIGPYNMLRHGVVDEKRQWATRVLYHGSIDARLVTECEILYDSGRRLQYIYQTWSCRWQGPNSRLTLWQMPGVKADQCRMTVTLAVAADKERLGASAHHKHGIPR